MIRDETVARFRELWMQRHAPYVQPARARQRLRELVRMLRPVEAVHPNQGPHDLFRHEDAPTGPYAYVQWKGTSVCADVHCVCGDSYHVDDEFFYGYRCASCGRTYAVGCYVALTEVDPKDPGAPAEFVEGFE